MGTLPLPNALLKRSQSRRPALARGYSADLNDRLAQDRSLSCLMRPYHESVDGYAWPRWVSIGSFFRPFLPGQNVGSPYIRENGNWPACQVSPNPTLARVRITQLLDSDLVYSFRGFEDGEFIPRKGTAQQGYAQFSPSEEAAAWSPGGGCRVTVSRCPPIELGWLQGYVCSKVYPRPGSSKITNNR
ncbi:hypothetical protein BDW74DRAFT_6939 [Aspergillus multicolor]|uniref:uncharacterized protein n=1 Tax=Aspergillus multicolor TaxID=41759 RepID=UPI003CCD03D7